jgi:DUF1680 family protein
VDVELPLKIRLETIDSRHTDTVALPRGPLVLMAVKKEQGGPVLKLTREQLLAAQRVSERQRQVISTEGPVKMLPFTSVGDLPYTTCVKVG